jgi:four helix bundle protein
MDTTALKKRVKLLALRIVRLVEALPSSVAAQVIGKQVLRSGTSVAANYYSACKARSRKDFISKIGIAEEEADETLLWLELITESKMLKEEKVEGLLTEINEIISMLAASRITAKRNEFASAKHSSFGNRQP